MARPKLNQIIAVVSGKKTKAEQLLTESVAASIGL
jgi:hypothetical protein